MGIQNIQCMSGSWQEDKDPRSESCSFMFDLEKLKLLAININSMTAESVLANMPMLEVEVKQSENPGSALVSGCVLNNCSINFGCRIHFKLHFKCIQ